MRWIHGKFGDIVAELFSRDIVEVRNPPDLELVAVIFRPDPGVLREIFHGLERTMGLPVVPYPWRMSRITQAGGQFVP